MKWEALKNKKHFGELYLDLVKTEAYLLRFNVQNLERLWCMHGWAQQIM